MRAHRDSLTSFNPCDRRTWPELLTADEVAVILRRKVGGLKKAAQSRTLVPAAFERKPLLLWRKADLVRHIDGKTTSLRMFGRKERAAS